MKSTNEEFCLFIGHQLLTKSIHYWIIKIFCEYVLRLYAQVINQVKKKINQMLETTSRDLLQASRCPKH